jgi:hypothetical protein
MKLLSRCSLVFLICLQLSTAFAQPVESKPGLQPYVPNRIEWLALVLNSQLRQDSTTDSPFNLSIVNSNHETILIFVRYHPNMNREIMNMAIDTARKVIQITVNSYGWDKWVKVKESVEMSKPQID